MRSICLALLVILTLLGIAPTDAASDADVIKQFGMLGRLAVNCAAPASSSNPYLTYSVSPQGKLIRTWGRQGKAPGEFDTPRGLTVDVFDLRHGPAVGAPEARRRTAPLA